MNDKINSPAFVVTVDTESDDAWSNPGTIKLDNLKAIPRFQELCEKYDVVPTYLITYECAEREEAVKILKPILDSGKCEIGHHLHVWSTPPFQQDSRTGVDLNWIHAYQSELPDELFFEKASNLKSIIQKNYGISPTSHRAGRWGIDKRTVKWLTNNDFLVDTSILPLTDFSKMKGKNKTGPNFFFEDFDIKKYSEGNNTIMEIPVTVKSSPILAIEMLKFVVHKKIISERNAYKILRKLGGGTKLTPSLDFKVVQYIKTIKGECGKGRKVINFSLHSSEVSLGHSPITRSKEGYDYFWGVLEESFALTKKLGLRSLKLSDVANSFK